MAGCIQKNELALKRIRDQFPLLNRTVHGFPLIYLDNAATTPKPLGVLEAMDRFYKGFCANVKRGAHTLSMEATEVYEGARDRIQKFIHAERREEIVFVRGATEAINAVAQSLSQDFFEPGDEILITEMEHHANIVSWQLHAVPRGVKLFAAPVTEKGELDLGRLESMITPRTKFIAMTHVSNVLGTINPVKEVVGMAHRRGIRVLVDGAQAVGHLEVNVQDLGCDFYVFSSHKMFGPTGVGVLYGKYQELDRILPWMGGGDMIESVTLEKSTYRKLPGRLEAGTPPIAEVIGLGAAVEFLQQQDRTLLEGVERELLEDAVQKLSAISGLQIHGSSPEKVSLISFSLEDVHPHDLATVFDQAGIAIRAGNHCAQPLMRVLKVPATARLSMAFYNTTGEIDRAVESIHRAIQLFRG
jgi:cysteine desulfurase/selenocysteine lyase